MAQTILAQAFLDSTSFNSPSRISIAKPFSVTS